MKKILIATFGFGLLCNLYAGGCCCYPGVSCAAVETTMGTATAKDAINITNNDLGLGTSWTSSINKLLSEIMLLKKTSSDTQKHISNLEQASLIEAYKEELEYINIIDYSKINFDNNALISKLVLLNTSLEIELSLSEESTDNEK